jgi:heme exporter protein B
MSVNTTGKDFILAILFIPLMFPLLYAVVAASSAVLIADPIAGITFAEAFWKPLALGAGYDVIMILAAFGLYEFIIGA